MLRYFIDSLLFNIQISHGSYLIAAAIERVNERNKILFRIY